MSNTVRFHIRAGENHPGLVLSQEVTSPNRGTWLEILPLLDEDGDPVNGPVTLISRGSFFDVQELVEGLQDALTFAEQVLRAHRAGNNGKDQ